MRILRVYLRREVGRMCQENIRFNTIGDTTVLHPVVQAIIKETLLKTAACDGMVFTLALGYGSHAEIVRTARQLAWHVRAGVISR